MPSHYLQHDTTSNCMQLWRMLNNIPHFLFECEFHEAQSAIDFCPNHPLSSFLPFSTHSTKKARRERAKWGRKASKHKQQPPHHIISTHIHTARAVLKQLCQWKISEKLIEGVVVEFSIHRTCFSSFFARFCDVKIFPFSTVEVKVLIFHPINHVNRI